MKAILLFVFTFIVSSCCGTNKVIDNQPQQTKEIVAATELPNTIETAVIRESLQFPKEDNSVQISLSEDGTVSDDGISITTEVIYTEAFDHSIFNALLKKHVSKNGNVDYKGFKNDSKTLQNYIDLLKTYEPKDDWSKEDKLAYWINAYNALTVDLILRNYPTKSIKDIKDPWDQRLWQFGNNWQNLNAIEHDILRKMDEPRIHFAIVCASVSCPKLQNEAFTASNLEAQLTNATKEFLADTSKNQLSKDNIKISKIFKWFKKDFEQNGSLIGFLNQYATVAISESAKKSYTDYNWDLND
ncbi:DUF547 domain-containing protein [Winogradskyella schleiferi]|uniref:DUF547 domain-containing protein n=1 Tax=Winogradskyella schleiferi TaxID=2686078 RepID=UPI0015BABEBB|nr:DUF547 domain-containing protein [Winogradskyella schleiferi]